MTRQVIPGALYGDHLPSGAFCALVPGSAMVTHLGSIALPPGETFGACFPRCTDIAGFRFAGQAHDTIEPACWEYTDRWRSYPQPCVGVSPVIYDRLGVLHRSDGSVGSQGYRYVTDANQIISGDATYGPFNGLFEYTDVGGLWIGQAAYDGGGVQVWDGSTLRQLETGDCRFVRANRDGETVALAFSRPGGVALILTTMTELRALPPVQTAPSPQPIPKPQPVPTPEPSPMPVPNQFAFVSAFLAPRLRRLSSLEDTRAHSFAAVKDCVIALRANDPRWGLLVKTSGDNVDGFAADIALYDLGNGTAQVVDIVSDAEGHDGTPKPAWGEKDIRSISEWRAPSGGSPMPIPSPQPVPQPQPIPPVPQPAPRPSGPSLGQWMDVEFPQLVAAYTQRQGHAPDASWGAFQGYRRFMEPDQWPFDTMLAHERGGQ